MLEILTVLVLTMAVFYAGLREFAGDFRQQQHLVAAVVPEDVRPRGQLWSRIDRALLRTTAGVRLREALDRGGITLQPSRFLVLATLVSLAVGLLLGRTLSWLLFPVGLAIGVLIARFYVRRSQAKRREAFIAQMPELARTLSNATSAGLSVRTALAMAVDELGDPAASELRSVTEQLNLGASMEESLGQLERRLPSRESAILISTLIVSARAGGGLVTALRDIAGTLETRKETRREIRTVYTQALATAYSVLGMGVGVLFLLDRIQEGTVDTMLRHPLGQLALVVSGSIYAVGLVVVRRMTRVDV